MSSSSVAPLALAEKKIPRRSPRLAAQNIPRRSLRLAAKKEIEIPPSSGGYHSKKKRRKKKHSSSGDLSKKKREQKKQPSSSAPPEIAASKTRILSRAEYRAIEKYGDEQWQAELAEVCCSPLATRSLLIDCYPRRPKYFDTCC